MAEPKLLLQATIPGKAVGKKTGPRVIHPGILALKLPRSGGRRGVAAGLKDMFLGLAAMTDRPGQLKEKLLLAAETVRPRVHPSAEHAAWHRGAKKALDSLVWDKRLPLLPEKHLGRVVTVVWMGQGQTGDLINFEQSVWDLLQDCGVIQNDHWINDHDGSYRTWDDPASPRIELELWDLGLKPPTPFPSVRVDGLTAQREANGPIEFSIVAEDGRRVDDCVAPRASTRLRLVNEAGKIWRHTFKERLPAGSRVICGKGIDGPRLFD